jgi:hypothetical protein
MVSFITMFSIPINMGSILLYGLIFFILFGALAILPDRAMVALVPILGFYVYLVSDYMTELTYGFQVVVNSIASSVSTAGVWAKYYDIPDNIPTSEYATVFLLFCMFLVTCLVCISTIKLQSCILGFVITFPFIECGLYFGLVPDYVSFFMVVCYWIALLSMALSGYRKSNQNKSTGFVRIGNSFYAKSNSNFHISEKVGLFTILMCIATVLLANTFVSISNYERSTKIDSVRDNVKESFENLSVDNMPYLLSRLSSLLQSGNNGTFNGTLGQKDTIEYDDVEKLTVTVDALPQNDIYLKGYVGSEYTGQSWDKLNDKVFKTTLFDSFKESAIYPQNLAYCLVDKKIFDTYTMTISPVNANLRTTYTPYFSSILNDYSCDGDSTIKSQNRDTYSFDVVNIPYDRIYNNTTLNPNSNSSVTVLSSTVDFDFQGYLSFVNENYLQVDDSESMENVKSIFNAYLSKYNLDFDTFKEKASTYEKLNYITEFLCYNYDYTLSPGKTPVGEDYVEYFLTQMDAGFCSHFASAGTILCRMLGIPARYAEGYYIPQSKFEESYTVTVEDNMAHAWAEIYIVGMGWINYDFTPGFNNNPTKADLMNAPDVPNDIEMEQSTEEVTQPIETTVSEVDYDTENSEVTSEPPVGENQEDTAITTPPEEQDTETPQNPNSGKVLKIIKNIVIFLVIVALIVLGVLYRRKRILQNRNKKISSRDGRRSVLSAYDYTLSLLSFIGFTRDEHTQHLEFAKTVSENLKYAKKFQRVTELVLQMDLSNDGLTNDEKLFVVKFSETLANTIYDKQNKLGKFIMKYLMCLI